MKRVLIIAAGVVVTLVMVRWVAWPRILNVLAERNAAKNRQANHLPEDALHALVSDTNLILFSIDPHRRTSNAPRFQRWPVLGQTVVTSEEQRRQLANTLQYGLSRWSGRDGIMCFQPRHAIRATDGKNTFDFLICFECGWLYYYPPTGKERRMCIRTKAGPFDDILVAANVPLSKQPRHR